MSSIIENFKDLSLKHKAVLQLEENTRKNPELLEEDDMTETFLVSFYDDAAKRIKETEDRIKLIEEKYKSLITFFGDTPKDMPMDTLIDIINKFTKDMNVSFF
jgi:hypothetical protein